MLPADERLGAEEPSVAELDHRLVAQEQLVALERSVQPGLDLERGGGGGAQRVVEDLVAVPAPVLGSVGGGVGAAEHVGRHRVHLGDRDADARRHEHGTALHGERIGEHVRDPPCDHLRVLGMLEVGAHDHEFVAAGAPGHVRLAEHAVESPGEVHQELVAREVAHGVVDELEPVEVDEQHCGVGARALGAREGRLEVVEEEVPVRQPGERVVGGIVREPFLELLAVGQVHEHAVEPARCTAVVEDRLAALLDPAPPAVAMLDLVLDAIRAPVHDRVPGSPRRRVRVARGR